MDNLTLIEKSMDISVPMGLGLDHQTILFQSKPPLIVNHRGNLLLLENRKLIFVHAEVVILLKNMDYLGACIIGSHDGKWYFVTFGTMLILESQYILNIVL